MSAKILTDKDLLADELGRIVDLCKNQILDRPNPRIQVHEFMEKWLPLLLSKVDHSQQKGGGPPILMWIDEVSKSAFQAVDVYHGEDFCYKVPPILNTDAALIPPTKGGLFEVIMQMRTLIDSGHTREAQAFADNELMKNVSRDPHADTFYNEMNNIAKFHGLPTLGGVALSPTEEKPSEAAIVSVQVSDF